MRMCVNDGLIRNNNERSVEGFEVKTQICVETKRISKRQRMSDFFSFVNILRTLFLDR